jgi:hypothetical protein
MASRKLMIGTSGALAGLAGLAVAAVTVGAPAGGDAQPASQPVRTQTQVVTTVERRTQRAPDDASVTPATLVPSASAPATTAPASAPIVLASHRGRGTDDIGDDHGDDRDDDDRSGHGRGGDDDRDDDSGHGGGDDDSSGHGRGGDDDESEFEDD